MRPFRSRWKVFTVASSADSSSPTSATTISPYAGVRLLPDDDDVAVEDPGLDHRVALHAEQEVGVAAERLRHGDAFLDLLLGEQGPTGRDPSDERQHRYRRCALGRLLATPADISSIARGLVGSRFSRPARSRFARCACTVDGEARPTASPISRTVGG